MKLAAEKQAGDLNGVQAEVQLCKYLKARLDQAPDQPATERELGGEVGGMMR